jgi:uncharacterized membrane protein YozB (DUF420 family)
MNGAMDSMMTGVMGVGWLPVLIGVALIIGGLVLVLKLLPPGEARRAGATSNLILAVLAVIGGIALVAVLAMGTMLGMRCCG